MTIKCPIRSSRWIVLFLWGTTLCLTLTGCNKLSHNEERVVGVWEFTGIDATGRIVYRRDHIAVELFPDYEGLNAKWAPRSWGSWRLEGDDIVSEMEAFPIPEMPAVPKRTTRTSIREFHEDKLVREENRSDLLRVVSGFEEYSRFLALFYVVASLVAALACFYAARNSPLRKVFATLTVAAVLALIWSASTLVAELAQNGAVIVSSHSLRRLRLPTEIVRLACVVMFMIGFLRLAFDSRAGRSAKQGPSVP
jgi:hypothetical protein